MTTQEIQSTFVRFDTAFINWARRNSMTMLRLAVGIVYVWFGALKLFPGYSPAEPLIRAAYGFFPPEILVFFVPFIGAFEIAIGLLFIYGKLPRITMALMLMQMAGAVSPIVLAPARVWEQFPLVWTLEGQYIFKDIILIAVGLTIAAATSHRLRQGKAFTTDLNSSAVIKLDNLR
jgi:uncharacterized membrane protein YkgB